MATNIEDCPSGKCSACSRCIGIIRDQTDELEQQLKETQARLDSATEIIGMIQDNTKMPHQHLDPHLRLYCLADKADEWLKQNTESRQGSE